MNDYDHTRNGLLRLGYDPEVSERLGEKLASCLDVSLAEMKFSAFEDEVHSLPWPQDNDFGALVLERYSSMACVAVSKYMLVKAIERARWCATCATSGGEGLARSQHIRELEIKLSKCN